MSIKVNTFAGGGRLELPVPGHQRGLNRRGFLNRENDVWVQIVAGRVDGETVVAARDHFVEQSAHPKRFTLFMDNAKIHHGGTFQAHLDRGLLHKNFSLPRETWMSRRVSRKMATRLVVIDYLPPEHRS